MSSVFEIFGCLRGEEEMIVPDFITLARFLMFSFLLYLIKWLFGLFVYQGQKYLR